MMQFTDAKIDEIESAMHEAWNAFHIYRNVSLKDRANLMRSIAVELEAIGDALINSAKEETNLPEARLKGEKARTTFQLTNYADACESASWMDIRIDTAIPDKNPPKPDLRKMMIPLGPVVVFGAANFPFAYSTAGGDTACALAAGCPVIVKAHPAHAKTSELVAIAISNAVKKNKLPTGVFTHVHGASFQVGKALVTNRYTKAVGFTGSHSGGRQLFDWANQRKEPIPVFAEMSSINPVFLLPGKMKDSAAEVAKMYAASITLGVGQFCTNPGLIIGVEGEDLEKFTEVLREEVQKVQPAKMLHPGIARNYRDKVHEALANAEVLSLTAEGAEGSPALATASSNAYLNNPVLHQEVFGPFSLIIKCKDLQEMLAVAKNTEGQLTATLMASDDDVRQNPELVEAVKNICGRLVLNGVPTGVEVCLSQQHGGPYPSTTDSRFTAVGADGIKRFARPVSYQNWPDHLLPDELKNDNPLKIWRTVNAEWMNGRIAE